MSKNVFDFIQMGLRSKKRHENQTAEKIKKQKEDAQAFNKAFTDKTYTVAKKVIENVEKVADYDYEAFFSRVNKVLDEKIPAQKTPINRTERSKDFDARIKEQKGSFDIEDYLSTNKDYRDSIIEKTKRNIQKKKEEADRRNINRQKRDLESDKTSVNLVNDDDVDQQQVDDTVNLVTPQYAAQSTQSEELVDDTSEIDEIIYLGTSVLTENLSDEDTSEHETVPEIKADEAYDTIADAEDIDHVEIPEDTADLLDSQTTHPSYDAVAHQDIEEVTTQKIEEVDTETTHASEPHKEDALHQQNYSKAEMAKNQRYYKRKRKEKFAKRMKVELEDNLIVKKKRSFTRLFKFSLSFKLSFVFMLLLVVTVVSLSAAFYFGIDYVIDLNNAGKMLDIAFFKDVLLVLLILFNLVAILLSISIGTKTSRELVRPIDEMTQIVRQINAKAMDRRLNVKGMHDELKELAVTFNEMLDRIENSYETQNRFTSDASHELRTPIAVIQGYINMLDRWGKADGEILDESIEAIKSESHNMKRLTEKLLLLAKADKGILELDFQPFSLRELIDEITRETIMIDKGHIIQNQINDVESIIADRESMKQAIRIFVDNSVKYTPEGGKIEINSYFSKKKIYIEIADNGIGIGKEDMENIFNRFYRVDKSRSKESGGHGLGLSIAKWIINQHKGEIEVKSELGKGTTITLILSPMG